MPAIIKTFQFYTYVYRDPRPCKNNEPIYVGKGHGNRYLDHLKSASNKRFRNKLLSIKNFNLYPFIEIFNTKNEDEAVLLEIKLIKEYGRLDLNTGSLCNLTNGGDGVSGYKIECPFCGTIGGATMARWHLDNCKNNPLFNGTHFQTISDIVTCPHCQIVGRKRGMGKHFENCKFKCIDKPRILPCLNCGKEHDGLFGKYGSEFGKYCCMSCSKSKTISTETKKKISDALTGRIVSEQAKINLRKALNGRKQKDHEKEAHRIAQQKIFKQRPELKQKLTELGKKNFMIYLNNRRSKIDELWPEALKIIQDEPKIHGWIGRVAEKMNITRAKVNIYIERFKAQAPV